MDAALNEGTNEHFATLGHVQTRIARDEGKKRQIHRMCEQVGLYVTGLKQVRIGRVNLGHLPVGQWRYLMPHEAF